MGSSPTARTNLWLLAQARWGKSPTLLTRMSARESATATCGFRDVSRVTIDVCQHHMRARSGLSPG